ncbi:hypothetical protein [Streptomyces sp. NBC_01497]|uniref:hypothetical protein n=1 Tax=Streptomyces sp. NBC_01497 TaxID=2903885 RepID=UPI002E33000A|nr:hypothetical protein [Streptomyces sp. NBC_01497]
MVQHFGISVNSSGPGDSHGDAVSGGVFDEVVAAVCPDFAVLGMGGGHLVEKVRAGEEARLRSARLSTASRRCG